jgi:putative transposase
VGDLEERNRLNGFGKEGAVSHSVTKIWIHGVWGTKERSPILKDGFRGDVFRHMQERFASQGCPVRSLNGTADHVHALFLLNHEKSLADVVQMVKGETSHWINQQAFLNGKFAWQTGYCGLSVSPSMVKRVEDYIRGQERHHRKVPFAEEYERFMAMIESSGNR